MAVSALGVDTSGNAEQYVEYLVLVNSRLVDKQLYEFAQFLNRLHSVVDAAWLVVFDIHEVASEVYHSKVDKSFLYLNANKIARVRIQSV